MYEYDTEEDVEPPFDVGDHRVEALPSHSVRRLVCVRCSGEADARHEYVGKPCRPG